MRIYIYPQSEAFYAAINEEGEEVATYTAGAAGDRNEAVLHLRDLVLGLFPGTTVLWVPDVAAHPEVRALLEAKQTQEDAPEVPDGTHLCAVCVHGQVCELAEVASRFDADVSRCTQHVTLPQETL